VEVVFLIGQETPLVNSWVDERSLSQHYTIVQTYVAKAKDFRGIVKHAGV